MNSRCHKKSWPRLSNSATGPLPSTPPLAQRAREKTGSLAPPVGSLVELGKAQEDLGWVWRFPLKSSIHKSWVEEFSLSVEEPSEQQST